MTVYIEKMLWSKATAVTHKKVWKQTAHQGDKNSYCEKEQNDCRDWYEAKLLQ